MGMKIKLHKNRPGDAPRYNLWQNSAYMIHLAWQKRKSVLLLCTAAAFVGVASALAELLIAPVILNKVELLAPLQELLITIGTFAAMMVLLKALIAYISMNTMFGRTDLRMHIVDSIHYKLATTSYPNTEDTYILKKLDRASKAVGGNCEATEEIWNTLTDLLRNMAGFTVYLLLLSSLNPFLAAVTAVTAVGGYLVNKRINEWGYRHRGEEAEYSKRLSYISSKAEDPEYAKDIRIFGMRSWLEDIYSSTMKLYQAFTRRREKVYIWTDAVEVLLAFLRNGIAYGYLIAMALGNALSASEFLLYFIAASGFAAWITGILSGFSTLHKQSLDISVVREFLETPEPFRFEDGRPLDADPNKPSEIQLINVSFRYPNGETDTLHNINLVIHPGEKLAVVGLNGAGKTTLVKLICGLYDPTEGEVKFNGVNIKEYNRADYYRCFAAVFQQFSLLEVTIAENVAQTDENADYARIESCLEKAGLSETVKQLPKGVNTHLGRRVYEDGIELSGGEMQRLMLARALYKDAPVILLDEPTAALDPIAENDIYRKYNEMTAGRTSVYISHRLASTRFCDRIIYLENGVIAEEGTHASLSAAGGKYAQLYEVQSRYYQKGGAAHE